MNMLTRRVPFFVQWVAVASILCFSLLCFSPGSYAAKTKKKGGAAVQASTDLIVIQPVEVPVEQESADGEEPDGWLTSKPDFGKFDNLIAKPTENKPEKFGSHIYSVREFGLIQPHAGLDDQTVTSFSVPLIQESNGTSSFWHFNPDGYFSYVFEKEYTNPATGRRKGYTWGVRFFPYGLSVKPGHFLVNFGRPIIQPFAERGVFVAQGSVAEASQQVSVSLNLIRKSSGKTIKRFDVELKDADEFIDLGEVSSLYSAVDPADGKLDFDLDFSHTVTTYSLKDNPNQVGVVFSARSLFKNMHYKNVERLASPIVFLMTFQGTIVKVQLSTDSAGKLVVSLHDPAQGERASYNGKPKARGSRAQVLEKIQKQSSAVSSLLSQNNMTVSWKKPAGERVDLVVVKNKNKKQEWKSRSQLQQLASAYASDEDQYVELFITFTPKPVVERMQRKRRAPAVVGLAYQARGGGKESMPEYIPLGVTVVKK